MIMFEFMHAKKIKKDIGRYKDDYYFIISHKPNGTTEVRGTKQCEFEQWKRQQAESEGEE